MEKLTSSKGDLRKYQLLFFFTLSFLTWIYCFKGFIFHYMPILQSDARAYYEHFDFFVRNLSFGEYPLWESNRQGGVPSEFFMRRIGSFNPLYLYIVLMYKIGISFHASYYIFLVSYYFLGMFGFYLLSKRIFANTFWAFCSFLLLMFSSLSTRVFDSYFLLTVIPMIWFFYFLVSFSHEPAKGPFLGITFCTMILSTTYIPFYFIMIFLIFVLCWSIIYFGKAGDFVHRLTRFISHNKVFVFLCLSAFLMSLLPNILLFMESGEGEIIMPKRGRDAAEAAKSFLEVGIPTITSWGILEDIGYSLHFLDLKQFKFAVFYVPLFAGVLFICGLLGKYSKKLLLLLSWALIIFIIFSPYGPVYNWLYPRVIFFKYFRNLHFYLWMAILPIFILICVEQFMNLKNNFNPSVKRSLVFITLIHVAIVCCIYQFGGDNISSYGSIALSYILISLYLFGKLKEQHFITFFLLFLTISIQPLQAYSNLYKNTDKEDVVWPKYLGNPFRNVSLPPQERAQGYLKSDFAKEIKSLNDILERDPSPMYMGTKWFDFIRLNLNEKIINFYLQRRIFLVDRIEQMQEDKKKIIRFAKAIVENENVAFVSEPVEQVTSSESAPGRFIEIISRDSDKVRVLDSGANFVKLKTHLMASKFMVYNDSYHAHWNAYVDGEKVDLYRTNIAFKGMWIPEGKHTVLLRYGSLWRHALYYFLLIIFNIIFYYLIYLQIKSVNKSRKPLGAA